MQQELLTIRLKVSLVENIYSEAERFEASRKYAGYSYVDSQVFIEREQFFVCALTFGYLSSLDNAYERKVIFS